LKGVVMVGSGSTINLQTKYGLANNNPYVVSTAQGASDVYTFNYVIQEVNRLQAWGFDELADGSYRFLWPTNQDVRWNTSDYAIPSQFRMPINLGAAISGEAFRNIDGCGLSSAIKDMLDGQPSGANVYYSFGDYFDPHFATCVSNLLLTSNPFGSSIAAALGKTGAPHGDYLLYLTLDEGDQTGFLNVGPDYEPVQNNGVPLTGVNASAQPGWVTLVTSPTQSSGSRWSQTYSDKEVYSKVALVNLMADRYLCTGSGAPLACCTGHQTGTCSLDPNAGTGTAVTGSNMTTAKNALNSAWGSTYTTLSTSDTNCTANLATCLQNGSYASWGTGTGLLDETGSHSWVGNSQTLSGETTAMQADMSAFLTNYLTQYFSVVTSAFHTAAPGVLLQMIMGGTGAPPRKEVLQVAAQYLDLPQLSQLPPYCPTCTDIQQRIDFVAAYLGDKPWMTWEGFFANPDSAESGSVRTDNMATTQQGRGAVYQAMVSGLLNAKSTVYGDYPVVGFYWWAMYDMNSEGLNWGLCTPSDNAYDGTSAVIALGVDQWGYSTGLEVGNYGDFLSYVTSANNGAISKMPP
jgi:hypothetical protein